MLCIVLIFLLLYCNFNYKLCPQISMEFFNTIRLRLINKVFYILKCSYRVSLRCGIFSTIRLKGAPLILPARREMKKQ